ncbi:MAG: type VI secretion system tip protein TssI/VgrG [Sandaracinaceae bacterium]
MSNDSERPEVPEHADPEDTLGEVAEQVGQGLDGAAEQIPEEEEEARAAMETAGDVASAVSNVVKAAQAAEQLGQALEAGDEGRAASAVGNLAGGVLGTTGALVDGVAGAIPEEAREGVNTAASVLRGAAAVSRSTERVVSTYQSIERAVSGRRLSFHTRADVGARLLAERASGTQRLSGLYQWRVLVEVEHEGGLDDEALNDLLRQPARISLNRDDSEGEVYGVLRQVEMLEVTGPRETHYDLTLVPKLWRLNLVKRSRVFQNKTHVEVALAVFAEHGFDPDTYVFDQTEESYPTHEYVVQHRETDFAFISRLLEHNGVHYRFEQHPRTEAIVLGDRNASFVPVHEEDELRYHPHDFAPDDGAPRVWGLRRIRSARYAEVQLRDYNWRAPHQPVRAVEPVDEETGYGFLDLYGEHVPDTAEATRLARVRAQEQQVAAETFEAKTSLRGVRPGTYFDLVNHPHPDLNQRYLVTETSETTVDGHAYVNTFKAIPFSVTYRPARTTPWPRIDGAINAIVDGEARSTATPIDEQGRYRVVLPFDGAASAGGSASRWVRRAQPSAGEGYGMHFPLHIGSEVAIVHVNGDPDRPLIVGAVPNAATQSPVIAGNAPQSRIRTGSGVVFELDDDC